MAKYEARTTSGTFFHIYDGSSSACDCNRCLLSVSSPWHAQGIPSNILLLLIDVVAFASYHRPRSHHESTNGLGTFLRHVGVELGGKTRAAQPHCHQLFLLSLVKHDKTLQSYAFIVACMQDIQTSSLLIICWSNNAEGRKESAANFH